LGCGTISRRAARRAARRLIVLHPKQNIQSEPMPNANLVLARCPSKISCSSGKGLKVTSICEGDSSDKCFKDECVQSIILVE